MDFWLGYHVFPGVLVAVALLPVLRQTRRGTVRFLRTRGVPDPRPDQVVEAERHLGRRRVRYVVLLLAVPPLAGLVTGPGTRGIVGPLLLAILVAEVMVAFRPGGRGGVLAWRDLVPRWAVGSLAALVVLAVGLAAVGLAMADRRPTPYAGTDLSFWGVLGHLATCLALVALLGRIAARRQAAEDEAVDAALRARTARVAVGIGLGWTGAVAIAAGERIHSVQAVGPHPDVDWFGRVATFSGPVVLVVSLVCWLWVAVPTRRSLSAPR